MRVSLAIKTSLSIHQLVSSYVTQKEDLELQEHALRLFLDTLPGLEASVVFKETVSDLHEIFFSLDHLLS